MFFCKVAPHSFCQLTILPLNCLERSGFPINSLTIGDRNNYGFMKQISGDFLELQHYFPVCITFARIKRRARQFPHKQEKFETIGTTVF